MSTIDGLTVEERGGPERNFCHPENPGSTHWLGCACHEAAWAEKLAAAEARITELEARNRTLGVLVYQTVVEYRVTAQDTGRFIETLTLRGDVPHETNIVSCVEEILRQRDTARSSLAAAEAKAEEAERLRFHDAALLAAAEPRIRDLEKDLRLNASMLAKQCDMARVAEMAQGAAEERARKLEEALREMLDDYRTEGCSDTTCAVCVKSAAAKASALALLAPPPSAALERKGEGE